MYLHVKNDQNILVSLTFIAAFTNILWIDGRTIQTQLDLTFPEL